jgi:hypothetical protein
MKSEEDRPARWAGLEELPDLDMLGLGVGFRYDDKTAMTGVASLEVFLGDSSMPAVAFVPVERRNEPSGSAERVESLEFESPDFGGLLLRLGDLAPTSAVWKTTFDTFAKALPPELAELRQTLESLRSRRQVYEEAQRKADPTDTNVRAKLEAEKARFEKEIKYLEALEKAAFAIYF